MKTTMVRYKVKPDRVEENAALIRAVYDELRQKAPAGLKYAAFTMDDGVTFVHVALVDTPDGGNPISDTAAFKAFQKDLKDRCDEPPAATNLDEVGSYGLFG